MVRWRWVMVMVRVMLIVGVIVENTGTQIHSSTTALAERHTTAAVQHEQTIAPAPAPRTSTTNRNPTFKNIIALAAIVEEYSYTYKPPAVKIPDPQATFIQSAAGIKHLASASTNQRCDVSLLFKSVEPLLYLPDDVLIENEGRVSDVVEDIRTVMSSLATESGLGTDTKPTDVLYMNSILINSEDPNPIAVTSLERHFYVKPKLYTKSEYDECLQNESICKSDSEFTFELSSPRAYEKYAYMIYPKNHYLRPLPSSSRYKKNVIYYSRILDLVLTPIAGNQTEDPKLIIKCSSAKYFPSYSNHICFYWSNKTNDWASDKCSVLNGTCNCSLTGELREGGQFRAAQYIDYRYLKFKSNVAESWKLMALCLHASLASFPFYSSVERYTFLSIVSSIMNGVQLTTNSLVQKVIHDNVMKVLTTFWISVGDDVNKQGYQFNAFDDFSLISVSLDENLTHPLTAVAFNGYRPFQFRVNRSMEVQTTDNYYNKHDGFGIQLTDSVAQYATSFSFLLYPVDMFRPFWPKPNRNNVEIFNTRVVHVVLVPRRDVTEHEDIFIDLYFKPSPRDYNVSVGCGFWNKFQDKWNEDGCQNILSNVCRCNLSTYLQESVNGGQFVVYQYSMKASLDWNTSKWHTEAESQNSTLALFRYLTEIPTTRSTLGSVTAHLSNLKYQLLIYKHEFKILIMQAMSSILAGMPFVPQTVLNFGYETRNYFVLIHSSGSSITDDTWCTDIYRNPQRIVNKSETMDVTKTISMDIAFVIIISNSVLKSNLRTTRTIYLTDQSLLPKVTYGNFTTFRERHVDIMLVPDETANATDQLIDMYFRPSLYRYDDIKIGCAYWSFQREAWIHDGCWSMTLDSCRCNMTSHFKESRARGLYAVFEYKFVNESVRKRNNHALKFRDFNLNFSGKLQAISMIFEYFSEVPVTYETGIGLLSGLLNILIRFDEWGLENENSAVQNIVITLNKIFSRMGDESNSMASLEFARTRLKNKFGVAEQKSLFDKHSLLKETELSTLLRSSDMTYFTIVNTNKKPEHQRGVRLFHPAKYEIAMPKFQTEVDDSLLRDSEILVMVKMSDEKQNFFTSIIIYTINKSLLPKVVKGYTIHFSRVVDIYFTPLEVSKEYVEDDEVKFVDIFFQPLKSHNTYLKVGCAHWSDNLTEWSANGCWSVVNGSFETCRCNLTEHLQESRSVARYMIFLFADKQNFQLKQEFNSKEIVFLVESVLSLSGFLLIIMTASLFSNWREEVGNKILLHLTASSLIYLLLTIYQETHYIYSVVSDRGNAAFIAFTAVVHYSRLSHYCWMLVMSVLQLKKYLTMVGASDIPHLLLKVSLLAWGLPLIPLIILLSWNQTEHFSTPNIVTQLALNFIPGALITFLNIVVLCVIVARICACFGWGEKEDLQRHGVSNRELAMRRLKATVLLFFLFGIPTAFEMFNDLGYHVEVLEYLYKMTDPMQGFVMFLFFVVFDGKTWGYWRKWMVDMRRTRPSGGNDLPLNVIKKTRNRAATHDK